MRMGDTQSNLSIESNIASQSEASDEALIRSMADGDKRAFKMLYVRHHVRVFRFVMRLTGNESMQKKSSTRCSSRLGGMPRTSKEDLRSQLGCCRSPVSKPSRNAGGVRRRSWTRWPPRSSKTPRTLPQFRWKSFKEATFLKNAWRICRRSIAK
jgi:hypothetical protein